MRRFAFILLLFISLTAYGQLPSVHQAHKRLFGDTTALGSRSSVPRSSVIPLTSRGNSSRKIIFGYLPYWEYKNARNYLRYDILTHLALFDFAVSSAGNISLPLYWPWTDVINAAHQNGVKVILTATNFNGNNLHTIMTTASVKQNFINQLKNLVAQYSFDGVNIDFESLNSSDRTTVVNSFMAELTTAMKTTYPAIEISFAGPAICSTWDVLGLANACDQIFIMGYAFYGSWSSTTGACAPLLGGTYNITNTVVTQYASVVSAAPQKLILGVPYYGLKWKAQTNLPHSTVRSWISNTFYRNDAVVAGSYGVQWAADNQTPYYYYPADTGYYQVWYDNDSSLGLKYDLAQTNNYGGVGMWALGYDGSFPELWNELYRRFVAPNSVENTIEGKNDFRISVFPNPSNAMTTVQINLPIRENIAVSLFDCLGRELRKIYTGAVEAGNRDFHLSVTDLSSGIYYVQFLHGAISTYLKIIILK